MKTVLAVYTVAAAAHVLAVIASYTTVAALTVLAVYTVGAVYAVRAIIERKTPFLDVCLCMLSAAPAVSRSFIHPVLHAVVCALAQRGLRLRRYPYRLVVFSMFHVFTAAAMLAKRTLAAILAVRTKSAV